MTKKKAAKKQAVKSATPAASSAAPSDTQTPPTIPSEPLPDSTPVEPLPSEGAPAGELPTNPGDAQGPSEPELPVETVDPVVVVREDIAIEKAVVETAAKIEKETLPVVTPATPTKVKEPKSGKKAEVVETPVFVDVREFLVDLLRKHFDASVTAAWLEKVLTAVENERLVSISKVDGNFVLEIHKDLLFRDRNAVRGLAAKLGADYKVNVNQAVRDYFGDKK